MLTLLMLALSDPAAASSSAITSRDLGVVSAPREDMHRCGDPLMQARQGHVGAMTLDRSLDDGQVRRYLLLDRRDQKNCPLPISYAVPDQRALAARRAPAAGARTTAGAALGLILFLGLFLLAVLPGAFAHVAEMRDAGKGRAEGGGL